MSINSFNMAPDAGLEPATNAPERRLTEAEFEDMIILGKLQLEEATEKQKLAWLSNKLDTLGLNTFLREYKQKEKKISFEGACEVIKKEYNERDLKIEEDKKREMAEQERLVKLRMQEEEKLRKEEEKKLKKQEQENLRIEKEREIRKPVEEEKKELERLLAETEEKMKKLLREKDEEREKLMKEKEVEREKLMKEKEVEREKLMKEKEQEIRELLEKKESEKKKFEKENKSIREELKEEKESKREVKKTMRKIRRKIFESEHVFPMSIGDHIETIERQMKGESVKAIMTVIAGTCSRRYHSEINWNEKDTMEDLKAKAKQAEAIFKLKDERREAARRRAYTKANNAKAAQTQTEEGQNNINNKRPKNYIDFNFLNNKYQTTVDQKFQSFIEEIAYKVVEKKVQELVEEQAKKIADEKAQKSTEEKAQKIADENAHKLANEKAQKIADEKAEEIAKENAHKLANEKAQKIADEKAEEIAKENAHKLAEGKAQNIAEKKAQKGIKRTRIQDTREEIWTEDKIRTEFKEVTEEDIDTGGYKGEECTIETEEGKMIQAKSMPVKTSLSGKMEETITKLKRKGYIRDSDSKWNNMIRPVPKPDGSLRLCMNMMVLNDITKEESQKISSMDGIFYSLQGAEWLTVLDLKDGYFQIHVKEEHKHKTAFTIKGKRYEWNRMPMGYKNAPMIFQRIMNKELKEWININCNVYLDDIVVYGRTGEEHDSALREILNKFKNIGLKINMDKIQLRKKEIKLLE